MNTLLILIIFIVLFSIFFEDKISGIISLIYIEHIPIHFYNGRL